MLSLSTTVITSPESRPGCAGGAAAAAEPQLPGGSGSSTWCWGSLGAGVTPGQGYKRELSQRRAPLSSSWCFGLSRSLLMLLEGFMVLWEWLQEEGYYLILSYITALGYTSHSHFHTQNTSQCLHTIGAKCFFSFSLLYPHFPSTHRWSLRGGGIEK